MFVSDTRIRVAALLADGLSVAEVARRLGLAYTTVSYHRGRLQSPAQPPLDRSPHEMVVENVLVPVRTREEVRRLPVARLLARGRRAPSGNCEVDRDVSC